MSEGIIIAIVGLIGSLLGASIGAFATLQAAQIKAKIQDGSQSSNVSCITIGLVASMAGVVGMILGGLFGVFIIQRIGDGTSPPGSANPPSNCIAVEQGPLTQADHFFEGPVHVIQLWRQNGDTPWGTDELMALVVGDVRIMAAGGNVWTYPTAECEAAARIHMQDGANQRGSRVLTEQQMRDAGLIR